MSDSLQDYYLSYIHPCQGLLLLTPSRAPQTTAAPSSHPSKAFVGVKKSNTILMSGDIGGLSSLRLWFQSGGLHLRGTRERFSGHPPNFKSYRAQPHPSTHLQTSPPTATSLLKTGDTFLPTYLSYSPLRSWSPILKGANLGVHPSHLGCRKKEPPQSHRWPPSSQLAQGLGCALGRGTPTRELWRGSSTPSQNWGHPPKTRPSPSVSNSAGEAAAMPQSDSPNTTFLTPSRGVPGPPKNPKKI